MYLFIGLKTIILLSQRAKIIDQIEYQRAEKILIYLDILLNKNSVKVDYLKGIIAVNDPDSFVGTRIILTIANTLAAFLKIPVVSLGAGKSEKELIKKGLLEMKRVRPGQIALPIYSGKPNINLKS